jgi:MscS family membrane protein
MALAIVRRQSDGRWHSSGIERLRAVACSRLALGLGTLLLCAAGRVSAQVPVAPPQPPAATPAPEAPKGEVAPDSPRASLTEFFDAARAGEWDRAARYLAVPAGMEGRAPRLAEQLKAVLDRHLWVDLESVSGASEGRLDDGLSPVLELIGEVPAGEGRKSPIRLTRTQDDRGAYWAFSRSTVEATEGWFAALQGRWIRGRLVDWGLERLLLPGPFEIAWWQWIALLLVVPAAWALGRLLGAITRAVLGRVFARTRTAWDEQLLARIRGPLTLAWSLVVFHPALALLGLSAPAHRRLGSLAAAGAVIALFWGLWRAVAIVTGVLNGLPWASGSPSAGNMLKIAANLARAAIALAGTVAVLGAFGYPVATLLAGLGIGGLAFAFGAQKTVENLFGSVSLAVDQPFRVGDFVKVDDFVGTVEEIGLRSTRFRTLDRTLISIPNGSLSDQRLESFTARDRMRLATTIGVEYGTTHEQMLQVLEGFERVLRSHPRIWPDAMVIKFKEFGASSLDIEVMAWFAVPTWGDFQACRQEVLLGFMEVVERAGTSFAFPTRTVHLVAQPGAQASPS